MRLACWLSKASSCENLYLAAMHQIDASRLGFLLGAGLALGAVQGLVEVLEGVAQVGGLDGGGDTHGLVEGLGCGGLGRQGDHGGDGQQQKAGDELLQQPPAQARQELGAWAAVRRGEFVIFIGNLISNHPAHYASRLMRPTLAAEWVSYAPR